MRRLSRATMVTCVGLLLGLTGCATAPSVPPPPPPVGDASWRIVAPPGTTRYQLAMGEVSSGATPFQRVTPVYPAAVLLRCPPPREVSALLVVGERGRVEEVRVADEALADADQRAFIAAVRDAALQWEFNPLTINRWAADADGNTHVVSSDTRPFSLTYVFRFACHGGRSQVSGEQTKS